ncbi:MAG: hypothetical protein HY816_03650 [Candidatus Wallbacteria bacterium]|nr:hypothetical protein [Candidatus Wallbacteria bacterium]
MAIESPFPLTGSRRTRSPESAADLVVEWQPEAHWSEGYWRLILPFTPPAGPAIADAADGSALISWPGHLEFVISPRRDHILILSGEAKLAVAPVVLVGLVLGYLLHLRGVLCLHGSVLARNGRAIGILGDSGAGKSTVATALIRNGATLVSDDLLAVSASEAGVCAEYGGAAVRLELATAKQLLERDATLVRMPRGNKLFWEVPSPGGVVATDPTPIPLSALYVLKPCTTAGGATIDSPSSSAQALQMLTAAWYPPGLLRLLTRERLEQLQKLAAKLPVSAIHYEKDWASLPNLVEILNR